MTIEVALALSVISVSFSIFFGLKNNKRSDTKEIEQRVAERTETNMKLDEIGRNVNDIKLNLAEQKKDVQGLKERVVSVESSCKQAHLRIDRVEEMFREGKSSNDK